MSSPLLAPWYESDHAIFALRGIPAVAITASLPDLLAAVAHHVPRPRHHQTPG